MRGLYQNMPRSAPSRRQRAFTLVEMLVSLAVLTLALSVVGVVFGITTKTTSQSTAYVETANWVRQFAEQVKEDLRYCDPAQSILVLVGRTQAAGLTADDLEAGKFYRELVGNRLEVPAGYEPEYDNQDISDYPDCQYSNPRADLMMFFTNRPWVSQAPPADPVIGSIGEAAANGVKFSPIQVVYGHAALGRAEYDGSNYEFPLNAALSHIEETRDDSDTPASISEIPANRWHLARRATIVVHDEFVQMGFTEFGERERISRCWTDVSEDVGDAAHLDLPEYLKKFGPNSLEVTDGIGPVQYSPYQFESDWPSEYQNFVDNTLYVGGWGDSYRHVATVLEELPVSLRSNAGVQLLPGCAWFQVEFLMPEDPRNSLAYTDPTPGDPNDPVSTRWDRPRWMTIEPGKTYVFVPDTPENRQAIIDQALAGDGEPTFGERLYDFGRLDQDRMRQSTPADAVEQRIVRTWPYAIRITVRVYDRRNRLDEPIVRTIIHRFE